MIIRYSYIELFWKTDMRHLVLDRKKNYKSILEKAFFYIFSGFLIELCVLKVDKWPLREVKNKLFEIGHIGYKKN
jgi:hypothetical protein